MKMSTRSGTVFLVVFWSFGIVVRSVAQSSKPIENVEATLYGKDATRIAREGETSLERVIGTRRLKITFHSFLAKSTDPMFPTELVEYGNEVSLVRNIDISVDGHEITVPRDVYRGLFDALAARAQLLKDGTFLLSISGADAAYSYEYRINFNRDRVFRLRYYSGLDPGQVLVDTRYFVSKSEAFR